MRQEKLIPLSDCLELWAKQNSIEIKKPGAGKERRYKIGRTQKGDFLSVDFKYAKNGGVEIFSARKLKQDY